VAHATRGAVAARWRRRRRRGGGGGGAAAAVQPPWCVDAPAVAARRAETARRTETERSEPGRREAGAARSQGACSATRGTRHACAYGRGRAEVLVRAHLPRECHTVA